MEGEESRVVDDEIFRQEFSDSNEAKQPAIEEKAPRGLLPKGPTLEPEEDEEEEQETCSGR